MTEQFFQAEHFFNRELSWLQFNNRVLEEAVDPTTPLLDRVKFLAIFSSNLDEFFMVRVSGLREQAFEDGAPQDYSPDGMRPLTQLQRVAARTKELVAAQYRCWNEHVVPQLAEQKIRILAPEQLSPEQREVLDKFFMQRAFPILTPMAIDPAHPSPRYHNRALYLATTLRRQHGLGPKTMFAVVQLPPVLPRLVPVGPADEQNFVLLEDVVADRLPDLFGGFEVIGRTCFRITRDSDIELLEQESDDMLQVIEDRLKARQRGQAVRLEIAAYGDDSLVEEIIETEGLHVGDDSADSYSEIYRVNGPVDLTSMMELLKIPGREMLRDAPFIPQPLRGRGQRGTEDLFAAIRRQDLLLHHPYDSFDPVVEFISRAAKDPHVLAIKQTLYRTSLDSPITRALIQAAENGKHVTALVELKARFDEENNVSWARQLERAGVHVVFGFLDLKTHCKVSLVMRQEQGVVRRYVHLGTGNYNPNTALIYTDMGLFTANEDVVADASALFNLLTGYSQGHLWRKLIVAPADMHRRVVEMIDAQAERARQGRPARIFAKLNALVDYRVIEALYRASQAGVPIDLIIRGICCLRPGLPGISENIRVRSIVDRFLEHSRIYVFSPDEEAEIYLASADWMPRNFYRRVEVMFPVEAPDLRRRILREVIPRYLEDNVKARILQADGTDVRAQIGPDGVRHRCQEELLALRPVTATATAEATPANGELASTHNGNGSNGNASIGSYATGAAGGMTLP
ncbi:MAG: polyphosphate kinase 1 [Planctomycetes bacterium]|nr:polyphosphate kinase 1 [Planctomycetota bacterium]